MSRRRKEERMEQKIVESVVDTESRVLESRMMDMHDTYAMDWQDALNIPPYLIPEDKVYIWARETFDGRPDQSRIPALRRMGWTPVPSDRHPELCLHLPGEVGYKSGYISYAGLVLYECSKELVKKRQAHQEQKNMEQVTNLPATQTLMGEPSMPAQILQNQTYLTKAAQFG